MVSLIFLASELAYQDSLQASDALQLKAFVQIGRVYLNHQGIQYTGSAGQRTASFNPQTKRKTDELKAYEREDAIRTHGSGPFIFQKRRPDTPTTRVDSFCRAFPAHSGG